MKFDINLEPEVSKNPVAYLIQGKEQKYFLFKKGENEWHSLYEEGGGTTCSSFFEAVTKGATVENRVIKKFYPGDVIKIEL